VKDSGVNKTILITRSPDEAWESVQPLIEAGFDLLFFPTIETVYLQPSENEIDDFKKTKFDYVVFSSANAVKFFLHFLRMTGIEFDFENVIVAAAGSKTAERCKSFEIEVDFLPEKFSAEGLLERFATGDLRGKRVLIPSSKIARSELSDGLKKLRATVSKLTVYDTVKAKPTVKNFDKLKRTEPHYFIFTSPSSFNNFTEIIGIENPKEYFDGKNVYAIGKTTAETIRESGIENVKYPEEFTLKSAAEMAVGMS
jgi:uroporphyrinogen-III synthase